MAQQAAIRRIFKSIDSVQLQVCGKVSLTYGLLAEMVMACSTDDVSNSWPAVGFAGRRTDSNQLLHTNAQYSAIITIFVFITAFVDFKSGITAITPNFVE